MISSRLFLGVTLIFLFIAAPWGKAAIETERRVPSRIATAIQSTDQLSEVKFQTNGDHFSTYFTTTGMILVGFSSSPGSKNSEPPQYFELQIHLQNVLPGVEITTLNPKLARTDFFGGDAPTWLTNIPNYAKVKYTNPYPDVDMLFQINDRLLDIDFLIAPGGDPRKIRFQIQGAEKVQLTPEGALLLNVRDVIFEFPKPHGYQAYDNSPACKWIDTRYVLSGNHEITLQVGSYDSKRALIIGH